MPTRSSTEATITRRRAASRRIHFVDSEGFASGLSYVTAQGFAGFAFSRYESLYAIPGIESAEEKSRIDMGQSKWSGRTEWKVDLIGIDVMRAWIGYSDYAHNEVVFDQALGADTIGVALHQ